MNESVRRVDAGGLVRKVRTTVGLAALAVTGLAGLGVTSAEASGSLIRLNRETWGITPAMVEDGTAAGQGMPGEVTRRIDAMQISRTTMVELVRKFENERRSAVRHADKAKRREGLQAMRRGRQFVAREAAQRSMLRNIYSPDQMREQMTWFWFNHFNVYAPKFHIEAMVADYEDMLRRHAFGRYRDLLGATLRHPAMISYLDNRMNSAEKINENYAREIMELHSMGVGSGYSQKDVQELARILTGVGIRIFPGRPRIEPEQEPLYIRDGLFEFDPGRHDFGTKRFLGEMIEGQGFAEVETALDLIAASPATARHVSTRMATFMTGSEPPKALVDAMVLAWQASDGDLGIVLEALLQHPTYEASLGAGFKDPVHYVVSTARFAYADRVIRDVDPLLRWLDRMGQGLYNRPTPDGYPLDAGAWAGSGQMLTRLEFARVFAGGGDALFKDERREAAGGNGPPMLRERVLGNGYRELVSRQSLATLDRAEGAREWNMLFLASPDFMQR